MGNLEVVKAVAISDTLLDRIGRVVHEANRAYCKATGDNSQVPWDDAPARQKDSVFTGIRAFWSNPAITPEMSHIGWMEHKKKEGWKFGPVKDAVKKEHPCMVPYNMLPRDQRMKDAIFTSILRAFAEELKQ